MREVSRHLESPIERIAKKLVQDPTWVPSRPKRTIAEKSEDTQQLLGMSIMRIAVAIYFTDRLVRRKQRGQQRSWYFMVEPSCNR